MPLAEDLAANGISALAFLHGLMMGWSGRDGPGVDAGDVLFPGLKCLRWLKTYLI